MGELPPPPPICSGSTSVGGHVVSSMSRRLEGMAPLLQLRDDIWPNAAGRPRHVVALAGSAGGLAALSRILSALLSGFPAPALLPSPILFLQHLDPRHRSFLA